ncbi:hypothetical protein RII68_001870 [Vibrio parahaemolyticus]|nr:hypothetical protein [Vibrio parahaemolyticus]EGR1765280.1 hypothetical protein [Vibrio parahaemolyticus]EIO3967009.1 hypothetical protein [Vibrio parahaemolyticus]EIO3989879.1 hypothetical protein [Vibrio parahaemolyticus]EJG1399091.1 hypothetical protein [Vibrio parahaemolyticus]
MSIYMKNIEQFSIYTAKIFEDLYSQFPVPVFIDRDRMIAMYLKFYGHEEMRQYRLKSEAGDFFEMVNAENPELGLWDADKQKSVETAKARLRELEDEEHHDRFAQVAILDGTLDFLVDEGLIVLVPNKGYRLTSKSFSHLNKTFEDASINEQSKSYITAIKTMFSETKSISREVLVGTAIAIVPKLLGYN